MAMTAEEKTEAARIRKANQRKREEETLETIGATWFKARFGKGTYAALNRIVEAGEFESQEEAFVVMIHNVDKLISCDSHAFNAIVDVKNLRTKQV